MHVLIASYGTVGQHKRFREFIQKKKYPVEGKVRKGYWKPHISELKIYDIRMKSECRDELLKDLGQFGGDMFFRGSNPDSHIGNRIGKIYKFLLRFLPITFVDMKPFKQAFSEEH